MKFFRKILTDQKGISLIQSMMMATVVGIVAALNMTITNEQQRSAMKNEDLKRAETVGKQIKSLLRNETRCRHFMGDFAPPSMGSPPGHRIDEDDDGTVQADENETLYNMRAITSNTPPGSEEYTQPEILYKVDGTYAGFGESIYNGLKIINFGTAPRKTGVAPEEASLIIYFFPVRSSDYLQTSMNVSYEFDIKFETTTGGHVTTCQAVN